MMTRILARSAIETIQADGWKVFMEQTARYLSLYGSPVKIGKYWLTRALGSHDQIVEVQGSKMLLDIGQRGIHSDLYINRIREPQATRYLQSIMQPDWVVVDIGANIGYYVLQEARKVKVVLAVEPGKDNFDHMVENVKLNGYKNVLTYRTAIGDEDGEVGFRIAKACNWNRIAVGDDEVSDKVPMTTLDGFLGKTLGGVLVDFVRMDVEGYEIKILEGMQDVLGKQRPRMFVEVHRDLLKDYGSSQEELLGMLADFDYGIEKSFISAREGPTGRLRTLLFAPDTRKAVTERGIASHMFFTPWEKMGATSEAGT